MSVLTPPPSTVYNSNILGAQSVTSLPPYSRRETPPSSARRQPTEHVFELTKKQSKPWAILKILSHAASPKSLPTFIEGDRITGNLFLDLQQDNISSVDIYIQGKIFSGTTPQLFLDQTLTLWSREMGDPHHRERQQTQASSSRYDGKLTGEFCWPFSVSIPKEVMCSTMLTRSGSQTACYRLPPTFLERNSRVTINYDLIVNIARNKFRPDSKIQTMFVFIPATRPDEPSRLRQLAYQENSPILGPEADLEGWKTASTVRVRGTVFSVRNAEVYCTISFAKPVSQHWDPSFRSNLRSLSLLGYIQLSYTRGSVIPLSLALRSSDTQVLDLLPPKAIVVRLQRVLKFREKASTPGKDWNWTSEMMDDVTDVASAVWWPYTAGAESQSSHERVFSGEIQIAKGLKPSCIISHLRLSYNIVLFPFDVTGFTPAIPSNEPLLEQTVEIATLYSKGPRPITYSPPNYSKQDSNSR